MQKQDKSITDYSAKDQNEIEFEGSLRPQTLQDVIGRDLEKKSIKIMIESARKRKTAIDHILFHGPPGLGKTTLAMVIGKEMGVPVHITSGSAIHKPGDLAAILTSLEPNSILFIDEIHRMRSSIEEILYPAMEDNALDIVIGKGPSARTLRLDLPKFTVIGATTKLSMLTAPLRDRFGMHFRLDFYNEEELVQVIKQKVRLMNIDIEEIAAQTIAKRARMTPRIAIRILRRVRDLAVINNLDSISDEIALEVMEMLDIDEYGLQVEDRMLLKSLMTNYAGRAVGLNTLAASISEEPETVETVYEPFLMKSGFIQRTPQGRIPTDRAFSVYGVIFGVE